MASLYAKGGPNLKGVVNKRPLKLATDADDQGMKANVIQRMMVARGLGRVFGASAFSGVPDNTITPGDYFQNGITSVFSQKPAAIRKIAGYITASNI